MHGDMILRSLPIDIEPLTLKQRAKPVGQQRFVIVQRRVSGLARFVRTGLFRIFRSDGLRCGLRGIGGLGSAGMLLLTVMSYSVFSLSVASEGIFSVRCEFSISGI